MAFYHLQSAKMSAILLLFLVTMVTLSASMLPPCPAGSTFNRRAISGRETGRCWSKDRCRADLKCCELDLSTHTVSTCQRSVEEPMEENVDELGGDIECPHGFHRLVVSPSKVKCIGLPQERASYTAFIFDCLSNDYGPLTLETQEEVDKLANLRRTNPDYNVDLWLGGQITKKEERTSSVAWISEFYHLYDRSYTNWRWGRPECLTSQGCHMVSHHRDNKWTMMKASHGTHLHYVCQRTINRS